MLRFRALSAPLSVATAASAAALVAVFAGGPLTGTIARVTTAGTSFAIGARLDRVSATLLLLVLGIAAVSAAYAGRALDEGPVTRRAALRFVLTVAGLVVLVTGASLPVMAVGWIVAGMAFASLLHVTAADRNRTAGGLVARRLLLGDLALVAGVVAAAVALPDLDRAALGQAVDVADRPWLVAAAIALVIAGSVRSALVPAHRWLAETSAAPTAFSALLHAGLVNGIGVLTLLAWPVFAAVGASRALLLAVGLVSAVVGTLQARARADVKGRLVTSTTAQMGFTAVEAGLGAPGAVLCHVVGHGCYKAFLFLGSGAAALPDHPAGTPHRPSRAATAVSVGAGVVVAVATAVSGLLPLTGPALVVLPAAAGWSAAIGLRSALAAHATRPVRVRSIATVLGATVAGLVLLGVAERAIKPAVEPAVDWSTIAAVAAVAAVAVAAAAVLLVDRLVAQGRLPRVHAWAVRSSLPPATTRWHAGAAVPPRAAEPVGATDRARLRAQLLEATELVAPAWPLDGLVAANPLAGLEHRSFDEATAHAAAVRGARVHLDEATYRALYAAGRIDDDDLDRCAPLAAGSPVALTDRTLDRHALRRALMTAPEPDPALVQAARQRLAPRPAAAPEPAPIVVTRAEQLDAERGSALAATIDDEVSLWAAQCWSDDHGRWTVPGSSLWTAWRHVGAGPGAARALGAPGFAAAVQTLPARADEALVVLLDRIGVAPAERGAYLARSAARIAGWTSHAAWRDRQAGEGEATDAVLELLAVRLAYEALLVDAIAPRAEGAAPALRPSADTPAAVALPTPEDLAVVAAASGLDAAGLVALDVDGVDALAEVAAELPTAARQRWWQAAYEEHHRRPLLGRVAQVVASRPSHALTLTPRLQVVTCIDVRSERLRRHLEVAAGCETLGFAGFFGVPLSHQPVLDSPETDRCPVLIRPRNVVGETILPGHEDAATREATRRELHHAAHACKHEPMAAFATAEIGGVALGLLAAARTFAPRWRAGHRERVEARQPRTALEIAAGDDTAEGKRLGFGLEERAYLAEAALRAMGLTTAFAPLVVLCGHGGHTTNNPFRSAYDCGACGGRDGSVNARVMASIANEAAVRERLAERGIAIPDTTLFVAALHDTTTDRVHLLDTHLVPASHRSALGDAAHRLDAAALATAQERAARRHGDAPAHAAAAARRRADDWAEVRPEWGLAGNAAMVIGPRWLTAPLDLDGRAFLHSYRHEVDPEGSALEVILTAPLVVAQWINSQYYFSTVDPEAFGAGDKAWHNPLPGVGVQVGPRGDLRVGLPRQAVFAADGTMVHEPMRLLGIVHAPRATVERIIGRQPGLARLLDGGWISLAVIDPNGGEVHRYQPTVGFVPAPADDRDRPAPPDDAPVRTRAQVPA